MNDYIWLHQNTYDSLADEYFERLSRVDSNSRAVGRHLAYFSVKKLFKEIRKNKYKILELGCGPGAILASLNDKKNLELCAIDLSKKMLAYAEIV
jgi:ubiquinone/menaquinone biosynthesis C-methylase UbiE